MVLGAVEFGQIFEVIWVSLVMGVGVSALFALVIHGSARATEARRSRSGPAAAYGALAIFAMAAFLGVVVFGITVILQKS
jgi:hypothetical protein